MRAANGRYNRPHKSAHVGHPQAHADIGAKMLERTGLLEEAIPLVRYHEERWDGGVEGPYASSFGLAGEEIPLGARIIAVADAWDAMVSDRPYRPTPGPQEAIAELRRQAGAQFDPAVVEVFLGLLVDEGLVPAPPPQPPLIS